MIEVDVNIKIVNQSFVSVCARLQSSKAKKGDVHVSCCEFGADYSV